MYSLLFYSFLISTIIFGIMQYVEKSSKESSNEIYDVQKHLMTVNNLIIFFMIFITCFALIYFAFSDNLDILTSLGIFEADQKSININDNMYDVKKKTNIDPSILKRINDPVKYGFEPYSGGSDLSSNDASSNSSSDDDISE